MGFVSLISLLLVLESQSSDPLPRPDTVPLPPGHRRFGTPITRADMLPGWETFPEDVPPARNCQHIERPLVQPVPVTFRAKAIARLRHASVLQLGDREAAALLGLPTPTDRSLAPTILNKYVAEMREQKRLEVEEQKGSWGADLEDELRRLTDHPPTRGSPPLKPYLVRAVTKEAGPNPWMDASLCGNDLYVVSLSFGYTIPPTIRSPAIIFLPKRPKRPIAVAMFGW